MTKVLKEPESERIITHSSCGAVISYTRNDIEVLERELNPTKCWIICPYCNDRIYVEEWKIKNNW